MGFVLAVIEMKMDKANTGSCNLIGLNPWRKLVFFSASSRTQAQSYVGGLSDQIMKIGQIAAITQCYANAALSLALEIVLCSLAFTAQNTAGRLSDANTCLPQVEKHDLHEFCPRHYSLRNDGNRGR